MFELYKKVNKSIEYPKGAKNIYEEGELKEEFTMRKFGISEFTYSF